MNRQQNRRDFLAMAGTSGLLTTAAAGEAEAPSGKPQKKLFTGVAHTLEQAISAAVAEASKEAGKTTADWLVAWTLKEVSGRQGGFAGFHEVHVTIEATLPPALKR